MSRSRRLTLVAVAIVVALLAVAAWALLPRSLDPVMVEEVRRLAPNDDRGAIAVTFAVPEDLAAVRARLDLGYIAATLAACDDADVAAQQVIVQRATYLTDAGRVRALGQDGAGRFRYRATFDDALGETVDHQARRSPAIGRAGGLCFSLHGGSMWFGQARSAAQRIEVR